MCIRDRYQRRVHGVSKGPLCQPKQEKFMGSDYYKAYVTYMNSTSWALYYNNSECVKNVINRDYWVGLRNSGYASVIYGKIDILVLSAFTLGFLCLLYTSPSPRDLSTSRMPSSA
eukprot:TRINITY_DN9126_c0_g1_i3.p2 TRINITY_DN9126_c0_g1~~TRINITY_DN9126_c0_g1_i3.p2  ORF type:complete len:115 (-),score=24.20 TRINITY_DN9126_c0_g1_i3:73-417(-)